MLFALYEENGEIHQANKLYDADHARYGDLLHEMGHAHVTVNAPGLLPPESWFVDVATKTLRERPTMPIEASKTRVKCGNTDSAVLKNCRAGSRFEIRTSNVTVHAGLLDGDELELFIPVPCIYRVTLDYWPYRQFQIDIEAVA